MARTNHARTNHARTNHTFAPAFGAVNPVNDDDRVNESNADVASYIDDILLRGSPRRDFESLLDSPRGEGEDDVKNPRRDLESHGGVDGVAMADATILSRRLQEEDEEVLIIDKNSKQA